MMACHLLEILISDEDGRSFLKSNPLLPQIAELLRLEAEPGLIVVFDCGGSVMISLVCCFFFF